MSKDKNQPKADVNNADAKKQAFKEGNMDNTVKINNSINQKEDKKKDPLQKK